MFLCVAVLALLADFDWVSPAHAERPAFDWAQIAIDRGDGTIVDLVVELAVSPFQQQYGLMFVTALDEHQGMLFIFNADAMRSFWMKNTLIPLDMLFFDSEGRLVSALVDVPPRNTEPRPSAAPARYVLELKGGSMARLGIKSGARLLLRGPIAAD